jgi:hypothetical protein
LLLLLDFFLRFLRERRREGDQYNKDQNQCRSGSEQQ